MGRVSCRGRPQPSSQDPRERGDCVPHSCRLPRFSRMKQRVFIGSSTESLPIARAIQAGLEHEHEPTVWDQGIQELTQSTLTSLIGTLEASDAGVFVMS